MSDLDPVSYFLEVAATHPRCFWLDGGGAREWSGRRSMIGWLEPDEVSLTYDATRGEVTRHAAGTATVVGSDPFTVLEAELAASDPQDHWFGYFGYAARPDLPAAPSTTLPDAIWMRSRHVQFFTHGESSAFTVPSPTGPLTHLDPNYADAFAKVQEHLHAGNSYEVNLTYRVQAEGSGTPAEAYVRLRALNPAPYAGFLQHDVDDARGWLLSSSPERYALITADRVIETKPIKGTTPRSDDPANDEAARHQLATDAKFRAENLMIVDLLRNDLSMVCAPGTVEVPVLMDVESYASVHQLVSTVRGRLGDHVTTVGALRALFPAGSMTGAPKLRTMQIIEEVEQSPRGVYAGAFGWLAPDGRADLGVVIRSLMTAGDGCWELGTGGGITVLSELDDEWDESVWKAERVLRALG